MGLRFWRKKSPRPAPRAPDIIAPASAPPPVAIPPTTPSVEPLQSPALGEGDASDSQVRLPAKLEGTPSALAAPRADKQSIPRLPADEQEEPAGLDRRAIDDLVGQIKTVIRIWEVAQDHTLSRERKRAFRTRSEMAYLIDFPSDELETAAKLTMQMDNGQLLLAKWLEVAQERQEIEQARATRRAQVVKQPRRRCPACDLYERFCICH